MRANRIVRVILGLLCLAIFFGYALIRASYSPMSGDFTGGDWATYLRENYGLNPDGTPVEGYVPAPTEQPQTAPARDGDSPFHFIPPPPWGIFSAARPARRP